MRNGNYHIGREDVTLICHSDSIRIFDKDDDGYVTVDELRHIMQSLGEKMTEKELDEMVGEADHDRDGLINYDGAMLSFSLVAKPAVQ